VFFKNDRSAALAKHKAVAVFIKRPGCRFWRIVSFGQSFHRVKASNTRFHNSRFRTARDDYDGFSEPDVIESVDDRVRRGCAGRNGDEVRAFESIPHRQLSGGNIGDHFGYKEGIKPWSAVAMRESNDFLLKGLESSNA